MKRRIPALIFAVGCIILIAAFGIGWANWGKLANQIVVMQTLMAALGLAFLALFLTGILSKGKEKWLISALSAILLLGFSVLVFFSIGWITALLALYLLGCSLWKIRRVQSSSSCTCTR